MGRRRDAADCVEEAVAAWLSPTVGRVGIPTAALRFSVKIEKIRHQLFLTKELSSRLERIAAGTGRARSELLVEALETWLNRRNPLAAEEALGVRLTRFERHVEAVRRQQALQWEVLARMLRHQLLIAAGLPPAPQDRQALAAKQFEALIDEIAHRLAGGEADQSGDPGITKLRTLQ
jgi:predicted transcriptional regulator